MKHLYIVLLILPLIGFTQNQQISILDFKEKVKNNEVEKINIVNRELVEVFIKNSTLENQTTPKKIDGEDPHYHFYILNSEKNFEELLFDLKDNKIEVSFVHRQDVLGDILSWILPIFSILFFIPLVLSWIKIYQKSNNPGWSFLIPFYNIFIYLQIIQKPWYWIFLFFVPVINIVFHIWGLHLLSQKFGKELGFTFGLVFLPFIFLPILGFDNSKYTRQTSSTKH